MQKRLLRPVQKITKQVLKNIFSLTCDEISILCKISFFTSILTLLFILQQLEILQISVFPMSLLGFYVTYGLVCILFIWILLHSQKKKYVLQNYITLTQKTLLTFFVPEILLLWGTLTNPFAFHYIFSMAASFYFLLFALFTIAQFYTHHPKHRSSPKTKKHPAIFIFLFLLSLSFFSFGLYGLKDQSVVDEPLWLYERIPRYWSNLSERDWDGTRISDKPGITVALISGIGLIEGNPKDFRLEKEQANPPEQRQKILDLSFALRLPLLIFASLSIFAFYFLLQKLLDTRTALLATTFIALSPLLLGISRILNPDSLLWIFLPLTLLSYFNFLKNKQFSYLALTGILLGLALLTKYIANIFIVFSFGIIFLEYIFSSKTPPLSKYLTDAFKQWGIILLFSLVTFYLLFPATWIDISLLLRSTILSEAFEKVSWLFIAILIFFLLEATLNKNRFFGLIFDYLKRKKNLIGKSILILCSASITAAFFNTIFSMHWFDFESILASPKSSYRDNSLIAMFLSGFYPLLYGISPIAFIFLIFALGTGFKKDALKDSSVRWILYSILFIMLYYISTSIVHVAAPVRYQITLYPLVYILSAIGLASFLLMLKARFTQMNIHTTFFVALIFIICIHIYTLFQIKPFYFSYASSLLPQKYVLNLKDMGDGSYQTSQFLNSLPGSENITIWSDKQGVCTFFVGNCYSSFDHKEIILNDTKFDHYVISSGRRSKIINHVQARIKNKPTYLIRFDRLYSLEKNMFEIHPGNRESTFVKVIDANDIDIICHECLLH